MGAANRSSAHRRARAHRTRMTSRHSSSALEARKSPATHGQATGESTVLAECLAASAVSPCSTSCSVSPSGPKARASRRFLAPARGRDTVQRGPTAVLRQPVIRSWYARAHTTDRRVVRGPDGSTAASAIVDRSSGRAVDRRRWSSRSSSSSSECVESGCASFCTRATMVAQLNRAVCARAKRGSSRVAKPAKASAVRGNRCRSLLRGRPTVAHLFAHRPGHRRSASATC